MMGGHAVWAGVGDATHALGAFACVIALGWLWQRRGPLPAVQRASALSLAATALWCLAVAAEGSQSLAAGLVQALRNLAYLGTVYALFAGDGRHTSVAQVRPVMAALAMVAVMQPLVLLAQYRLAGELGPAAYQANTLMALLQVVGSLVLLHNLYAGGSNAARQLLRWPVLGLAAVWVFELNLYTAAYLGDGWPEALAALHGLADTALAAGLALGTARGHAGLRLRPSRAVAFRSVSLLLIGVYLAGMVAVARGLAVIGGGHARWLQFGFLILASALVVLALPSRRLRGWLRITLTKHLFEHRYDYRAEWLRFSATIGGRGADAPPLYQRAIQALADITDSPGGLLLLPDEEGEMVLADRWRWPEMVVPAPAFPRIGAHFAQRMDFIVDFDAWRGAGAGQAAVPAWLMAEPAAWAMVPLLHAEQLVGAVILARPPHSRRIDWEDFDLLRIVGRHLGTYLAEHHSQQALAEAARFDEFNRRMAFVMHDIKNLASQFALLARNAERHAENPAFRADMLITLRASADKLNTLVSRLSRYGGPAPDRVAPVSLGAVARGVAARFGGAATVSVVEREEGLVLAQAEALEQALMHLVQNAVDASPAGRPVYLFVCREGAEGRIDVQDNGCGMSADFLRTRLFRPFVSTKPGGFGIGTFEAREMVRAMHGRLDAESREGLGSCFTIRLPLAAAGDVAQVA